MTKKELLEIAKELKIENYSSMNKEELEVAIAKAQLSDETQVEETVEEDVAGAVEEETQVDTQTEDETDKTTPTVEAVNTGTVKFKKTIKGAFGFRGKSYNGIVELDAEEAQDKRIKHALETGILEKL